MSASKPEPKVLKKQIQSKIDTGVSKKPSTLTLIKSRQPSTISRASSRQSNSNATAKKPPNASSSSRPPRPNTSFMSTRISHSSKLNLAINDRVQQGVHRLGKLPPYLRNSQRPATATSKLRPTESETKRKQQEVAKDDSEVAKRVLELHSARYQKFQNELPAKYGQYAMHKNMLDGLEKNCEEKPKIAGEEPNVSSATRTTDLEQAVAKICAETDQTELGVREGCPPCEGHRSRDTAAIQGTLGAGKHMELEELFEKMKQLQEKCEQHEVDCRMKQERIVALECELVGKCETIEKLQNHMDNAKLISKSRESIAQDNVKELESKLAEVRAELVQKCNDLTRSENKIFVLNSRIVELQQKLTGLSDDNEEKDKRIFELTEKEVELDALNHRCEELTQQIIMMKEEATAKVSLQVDTPIEDPIKDALLAELETKRTEVVSLRQENEKLRYENSKITNDKKQQDVLFEIRQKLLDNIQRSKEAFKVRCEEFTSYEGDAEVDKEHERTRDILFQTLAEKQRRCCREEQIISEIDQNTRKCKAVRNSLLHMVKRFKNENRQMREIMLKCGPNVSMEPFEEPTKEGSQLKKEVVDRMLRLFPEESLREFVEEARLDEEEKVTKRIIYDEQILSKNETEKKSQSC
ncbi:GRIP and coiled-coil domain-containing protein 2 isoform X2 [Aedes aegypti]|uniref:Uncharacterized protein n=1 Tax=Aedes aegypti TaxID=7159 RepID=A0A6I8TCX2_AEDAE|nr:GRIP and coiled-coil domain-containing protein 2 isoform X2 [Aedes aegypti]